MARPDPYLSKLPNELIRAGDWNELQVRAREEIQSTHNHTGGANGALIDRGAIAREAIDGDKIDPLAVVTVQKLTVSGPLTISGATELTGPLTVSAHTKLAGATFTMMDWENVPLESSILADNGEFNALMVVGSDQGRGKGRWIRMYDTVSVEGSLTVSDKATLANVDVTGLATILEAQVTKSLLLRMPDDLIGDTADRRALPTLLSVYGKAEIHGSLAASGVAAVELEVSATAKLKDVEIAGGLQIGGYTLVNGEASGLHGPLTVFGLATLHGGLLVSSHPATFTTGATFDVGAKINQIGIGGSFFGPVDEPHETIQLSTGRALRICFGSKERFRVHEDGVTRIIFDSGFWQFDLGGNVAKYDKLGKLVWDLNRLNQIAEFRSGWTPLPIGESA